MSRAKKLTRMIGPRIAPHITKMAPGTASTVVLSALDRAIHGVGRLPSAASAADKTLAEHGDVDKAIHAILERHVRYAGAQGFLTNLGGLVTLPVTIPANVAGLALIQCHLVAEIAHLRGYDLEDERTRSAILVSLLGPDGVDQLVKRKQLPGTPMAIATAAVPDPSLARFAAVEVATELIGRAAGKRVAGVVARRTPVLGGVVGLSLDAYATWRIGRYVDREFFPRMRR